MKQQPYAVTVRDVPGKGRGVFALADFRKGQLIELCPVLVIPPKQAQDILNTKLEHYAFDWEGRSISLVLGYGMIYNHSYEPNAQMVHDIALKRAEIRALRRIKAGEEITLNYNGDANDRSPLWFDVVDAKQGK